jgi:nucleoside-diphosphate-sugar epimerase
MTIARVLVTGSRDLAPDVELIEGDVRDPAAVRRALHGVDAVYHLAARVGVGQSMYEVAEYTSVNNFGTAVLPEAIIAQPVQRLIPTVALRFVNVYGPRQALSNPYTGVLAIDRVDDMRAELAARGLAR